MKAGKLVFTLATAALLLGVAVLLVMAWAAG